MGDKNEPTLALQHYIDQRFADLTKYTDEQLDSLNMRLNERFSAQEQATAVAMHAADAAVAKAETITTQRFEQTNEWRSTVNDIIGTMMPRAEYALQHQVLAERQTEDVKHLEKDLSDLRERFNSARVMNIILTCMMTGIFGMVGYLIFVHIK